MRSIKISLVVLTCAALFTACSDYIKQNELPQKTNEKAITLPKGFEPCTLTLGSTTTTSRAMQADFLLIMARKRKQ